jgi:MFS family permease
MSEQAKREVLGVGTAIHVALITVLTATPIFLTGAANDLIRQDLGLRPAAIGLLFTLYWLGSLAGAYVSRRATGSSPVERRLSVSVLASATALGAMALYPRVGLWLGAAIGGAAYGYSQPFTNFLLMRRCVARIQGFSFGLKQAAIPAATLLCSLSVPVFAVPLGWRQTFGLLSALFLVYALVMMILAWRATPERRVAAPVSQLPLNWHLAALALAGGLGAAIGNSLGGFLITTLTHGGISLVTASMVAAVASIANVLVRVFAGVVVDRSTHSPQRLLAQMFAVGMVGTALLAMSSHPAQMLGAVLAYGGGWGWAGLLHYVTGAAYPGREGRATAVSQMGVSAGAASGPLIFGWLFTAAGADIAWLVMSFVGAAACLSVLIAHRLESAVVQSPTGKLIP